RCGWQELRIATARRPIGQRGPFGVFQNRFVRPRQQGSQVRRLFEGRRDRRTIEEGGSRRRLIEGRRRSDRIVLDNARGSADQRGNHEDHSAAEEGGDNSCVSIEPPRDRGMWIHVYLPMRRPATTPAKADATASSP